MSTHNNIDKICVAFMVLALIITVLFMNGEKLGITVIRDEDSETYEDSSEDSEYFTKKDLNGGWDTSEATVITLSDDGITYDGSGVYINGNSIVIATSGEYVISGELSDGSIVVDANENSKVYIMLDGVSVYCSDNAAFRVNQADKVFMTLAEGSVNSFESGETYSDEAEEDGADGVIYTHDDLTINGSGELNITASYKHGIEANDKLKITGGTVTISAPKDGITVNEVFAMKDADITIDVSDDAIHSDEEIYIESGTLLVNSCYEGLESPQINIADGDISIYPSDDALNASNGDNDTSTLPRVHITGGNLTVVNETGTDADGIDSNGDIIIDGGSIFVNLNGQGTNNALDFGSESGGICEINGGTVIACGSYNMAESADSSSQQVSIMYTISDGIKAGETVQLEDSDENVIMEFTLECDATCLILSCPELKTGETYLLVTGDTVDELSVTETSASYGDVQSSGFFGSMNFGNRMGMDDFRQKHGNGGMKHQHSQSGDSTAAAGESESSTDNETEETTQAPSGEEPPAKPDGDAGSQAPSGEEPPAKPDGDAGSQAPSGEEPPAMPDGDSAPQMPGGDQGGPIGGMGAGDSETAMTGGPQGGMDPSGQGMGMGQGGPGMENTEETTDETGHSITEYDSQTWLIYGGCFALALAGVIIAVTFKRRHY